MSCHLWVLESMSLCLCPNFWICSRKLYIVYRICIQIASLLSGIEPTSRRIGPCLTAGCLRFGWSWFSGSHTLWTRRTRAIWTTKAAWGPLTVTKYFEGRQDGKWRQNARFRVFERASESLIETLAFSGALVVLQKPRGRLTARVLATPIFFLHAAWSLGKRRNNWTLEWFQACQHHSCQIPKRHVLGLQALTWHCPLPGCTVLVMLVVWSSVDTL